MAYVGLAIGIFFRSTWICLVKVIFDGSYHGIHHHQSNHLGECFLNFFSTHRGQANPRLEKGIPSQKSCTSIDDAAQEGFLERWGLQKSTFCFVNVSFLTPRTSQNIDTCSCYNAAVFSFKHLTC